MQLKIKSEALIIGTIACIAALLIIFAPIIKQLPFFQQDESANAIRLKFSVSVQFNGNLYSGYSIQELRLSGSLLPGGTVTPYYSRITGQSVILNLSERSKIAVLMRSDIGGEYDYFIINACFNHPLSPDTNIESYIYRILSFRGTCKLDINTGFPKFAIIEDKSDPYSITLISPNTSPLHHADDFEIVNADYQYTTEPITTGIVSVFPWLATTDPIPKIVSGFSGSQRLLFARGVN